MRRLCFLFNRSQQGLGCRLDGDTTVPGSQGKAARGRGLSRGGLAPSSPGPLAALLRGKHKAARGPRRGRRSRKREARPLGAAEGGAGSEANFPRVEGNPAQAEEGLLFWVRAQEETEKSFSEVEDRMQTSGAHQGGGHAVSLVRLLKQNINHVCDKAPSPSTHTHMRTHRQARGMKPRGVLARSFLCAHPHQSLPGAVSAA